MGFCDADVLGCVCVQLQYTAFERDFVDNVIEDGKNGGAGGVAGSQPEALQEAAKFLQAGPASI